MDQPCRELFVWAVFFRRMSLAKIFWKECSDKVGSAVVACVMFKSLAEEAKLAGQIHLANELVANAGFVISY